MFYSDIGKKVKDFFKSDTYNVGRTTKVEVKNENSQISVESKLTSDDQIRTELKQTYNWDKNSFTLTASNKESPKLELKTQQYFNCDIKKTVKSSTVDLEIKKSVAKFNTLTNLNYNWNDQSSVAKFETTYEGVDNLAVGFSASVSRQKSGQIERKDFDVGLQYNLAKDRAFVFTTGKNFKTFNFGSVYRFRETEVGYTQIDLNSSGQSLDWRVGVDHKCQDSSHVQAVYRNENVASVLYNVDFPQAKANVSVVCNCDFKKQLNQWASFDYKLNFSL